jgi:hypothetical protein
VAVYVVPVPVVLAKSTPLTKTSYPTIVAPPPPALPGAVHDKPTAPRMLVLVVVISAVGASGAPTGGGIRGAVAVAVFESMLCVPAVSVTKFRARTTKVYDVFAVRPVAANVVAVVVVPRRVYVEPETR